MRESWFPTKPGTFVCHCPKLGPTGEVLEKGICFYMGLPKGEETFKGVIEAANSIYNRNASNPFIHTPPGAFGSSRPYVMHWYEKGTYEDNVEFGKKIIKMDTENAHEISDDLNVTIKVYSVKNGLDRNFGLEISAQYKEESTEALSSSVDLSQLAGSIGRGLVTGFAGFGSPLSNYIEVALEAKNSASYVTEIRKWERTCKMGHWCNPIQDNSKFYVAGPVGLTEENTGLKVKFLPKTTTSLPNNIILEDLDIQYAVNTGATEGQVIENLQLFNGSTEIVDGHSRIVHSQSRSTFGKSSELLKVGSMNEESTLYVLIAVDRRRRNPDQEIQPNKAQRMATATDSSLTDRQKLTIINSQPDSSQYSLKDVLDSVSLVCFADLWYGMYAKSCGLRFSKISSNFFSKYAELGYYLKISVDEDAVVEKAEAKNTEKTIQSMFGAKFNGEFIGTGYYQLPQIKAETEEITVTIELDDKDATAYLRDSEASKNDGVVGIELTLRHFPQNKEQPFVYTGAKKFIKD